MGFIFTNRKTVFVNFREDLQGHVIDLSWGHPLNILAEPVTRIPQALKHGDCTVIKIFISNAIFPANLGFLNRHNAASVYENSSKPAGKCISVVLFLNFVLEL